MLGQTCIQEDPTLQTNIRSHVYDSDEVAAYPTATSVANVSKATTKREIVRIEGIDEFVFRKQNMNAVIGESNALEYSKIMFQMPSPVKLLAAFNARSR